MSDAVHVEHGAPAWCPSSDTVLKTVLHRYDIPLAGIIEQHGVNYLFWCVTGHAAPDNAWAYAPVGVAAIKRLEEANGDSFDDVLREAIGDNACTFAVASDDQGIIASVILSPPARFDDVHQRGMAEMVDRYREMFTEYQILQERFPLLRSAVNLPVAPSRHAAQEAS